MEEDTKRILFFVLSLLLGAFLVFSGYFWKFHILTSDWLVSMFSSFYQGMAILIAIILILIICIILIVTPIAAAACPLFLKIAYELLLGRYAGSDVFNIGISFRPIVALICIFLAAYSLYRQWKVKFTKPKMKDKDLLKFI